MCVSVCADELLPAGFPGDSPSLLSVMFVCEEQAEPWRSLCMAALTLRYPQMAVLANCYKVWLRLPSSQDNIPAGKKNMHENIDPRIRVEHTNTMIQSIILHFISPCWKVDQQYFYIIIRELCYSVSPKCTNLLGAEHSVVAYQDCGMN